MKEPVLMAMMVTVTMVATKAVEGRRQEQSEHLADSEMPTSNAWTVTIESLFFKIKRQ